MTGASRLALAVLATLGFAAAIAAGSHVPTAVEDPTGARLRLAWKIRGDRVETCRTLSADELAALPPHMRRERVCEGRVPPYHLTVVVNGTTRVRDTVYPAGARSDRGVFVLRDLALAPGRVDVDVSFVQDPVTASAGPVSHPLRLLRTLDLDAGQVALVTYDADSARLVLRGTGSVSPR